MDKFLRSILAILFLIIINEGLSQPIVHVDERFELTGIVFSLTGEEVYHLSQPENYVSDIETHFGKFKEHPLIRFIQERLNENFYMDFPCTLAADLVITSQGIVFTDKWITYYEDYKRYAKVAIWNKSEFEEYLRLLNDFYEVTEFHDFFIAHNSFYIKAEKNLQVLVNQIDTAWFSDFFGQPFAMENIWLVPAFGANNFGFRRIDSTGQEYNNCILGCIRIDENGDPFFNTNDFKVIIHEICHNYSQPMWEKYYNQCETVCDSIFSDVGDVLSANHYGMPSLIVFEGMNRLYEHCYYKEHNTLENEYTSFECSLIESESIGFPWLSEALFFMDNFYKNRHIYANCEDFAPELIGFLRSVAANMKEYYYPKLYDYSPLVINTFPPQNSTVDANIKNIMFKMSKPIDALFNFKDLKGNLLSDDIEKYEMTDKYTYVVTLKKPLKPHTQYSIFIQGIAGDCNCTNKRYVLNFKTR